jgi:hypothetical protein
LAVSDEPAELLDGNAAIEPLAEAATAAELEAPDGETNTAESEAPNAAADDGNVASLDDARDAAARESETDFNAERAEVVPIKKR